MTLSLNQKAALLSLLLLAVGLLVWEAAIPGQKPLSEMTEYERLTGGGAQKAGVPPPSQVIAKASVSAHSRFRFHARTAGSCG